MIQSLLLNLATLYKVGRKQKAPGTWGTLATVPLAALLMLLVGPIGHMIFCILFTIVAIISAQAYEDHSESHDSKHIVIDEAAGFLITMVWLPLTWQSFVYGFILFRILDIFKPPPISFFDKKVKGGLGVVADDVVAGIIANLVLQILLDHYPRLFLWM